MNKNKIKWAIMSISSLMLISMTASAILADIQSYFIGVNESLIQMVLTLPALVGLIFSFASGPLLMKISKKNLVIFALLCGFAGGILAFFFGSTSIYVLLGCSMLIGVAQGMNATMSMALIADYFVGEEAGSLMGLQSAFVNGGSMVLLFVSGLLAGIQWNYSYIVYLLFIPVIFIVLKTLPQDHPVKNNDNKKSKKSEKLNLSVYGLALLMLLFSTFLFVFQTNVALLVVSKGFGDAATSGLINTAMSASGMIAGIMFGKINGLFKKFTVPVALCVTGMGMLIIFSVGTLPITYLSAVLCGLGFATVTPAVIFLAADAVVPSMKAIAIAIVTGASSLGIFLSPLISNTVMNALHGDITIKFLMAAIGIFVLALTFVICNYPKIRENVKEQIN